MDIRVNKDITVRIRTIEGFPIKGCCSLDDQGKYDIFLREGLSDADTAKSIAHEILHIIRGDFSGDSVGLIEHEAHKDIESVFRS